MKKMHQNKIHKTDKGVWILMFLFIGLIVTFILILTEINPEHFNKPIIVPTKGELMHSMQ